ncbi:SDR family oxidoreductase [Tellurirhabdus rosea]|uniref:SDR family oxidoreductase n=1 Tax=Tellurirhabdus rosea TaxID=2674997 RepID=UPI002250F662|nr:SDR family oxidoreductase [Tellurirhabdus rosea]
MPIRVLITGSTGNVGLETLQALNRLPQRKDLFLIAATQQPERDRPLLAPLTDDLIRFDFTNPASTQRALEGVEKVLLIRPPQLADVKKFFDPLVRQMQQAGVRQVVFLSLQGVESNAYTPHHKIELILRESGMAYTFLRPSFFMQNLSTTHRKEIQERNEIFVPAGNGRTAFIDVRDIAEVAALALATDDHLNQAYELTGSEALTYYEIADMLTAVLGRKITYKDPSILRFLWRKRIQEGVPLSFVMVMIALYTVSKAGKADTLTDVLPGLLGRPPILFRQFAEDMKKVWDR